MFIRTVETRSGGKTHRYLRVVENYRDDGKIKQRVLWNLGNLEKIRHKLPGLAKSLGNHSGVPLVSLRELKSEGVREYGNMLLLRTLWKGLGIEEIFSRDKTAERMRPYIMAVAFHRLLNPRGLPPITEWLDRVYLPELEGPSRSGRARLAGRILRLFEYLERDGKGRGLRVISKTTRKKSVPFCFMIKLKMNALAVRGSRLRQKESLLVILTAGGVPRAYGIYDGKSPLAFMHDVLTDDGLVRGLKGRKTVFVANRSTIGDGVTDLFNREGIPYIVFINRWSKKGVRKPLYKVGRGYVAQRIKTSRKKGPRVYILSKKAQESSRTKRHVECALKTNMTNRAFLAKAVKARRECLHLEEFFGNITPPAGVLSRVEYKRGYTFICFLTYLLARTLDRGLSQAGMGRKLTPLGLLEMLKDIKLVTNVVSGRRLNYVTKIPTQTRRLLRAFGVKNPRTFPTLSW
ncbi:MAG: hypothetical protein ACE5IC_09585 [Candidatus Brocadiales bacterium]